jgi:hypothetical protein
MAGPFRYRGFPVDSAHQTAPVGKNQAAHMGTYFSARGARLRLARRQLAARSGPAYSSELGAMVAFGSPAGREVHVMRRTDDRSRPGSKHHVIVDGRGHSAGVHADRRQPQTTSRS